MLRSLSLLLVLTLPCSTDACSVSHVLNGVELINGADLIVRATALNYETPPSHLEVWTTGVPDSVVNFRILEVVRGDAPRKLTLHGYLVQRDDFNDQKSPYTFVRPGGREGSCFANSYKQGANYLLFLKKDRNSPELTVNWAALAPVNEQLHDSDDPWLIWVRKQVKAAFDQGVSK